MSNVSFKSLLANLPVGLTKRADIESPDEVQLEQDFARLAYTFLKDRAPGLMPYLLGFEVVEREEDGSKAVGIFGFKIGKDYYYVPSFFVNNQIKGMDLLFSKSTNMFMPLREQWINHIINRQTIQLGGPTMEPEPLLRRQFERPRFDFLAVPPNMPAGIGKASEAKKADDDEKGGSKDVPHAEVVAFLQNNPNPTDDVLHAWAEKSGYHVPTVEAIMYSLATKCTKAAEAVQNGFAVWNDMQRAMVEALEKDAEFQKAWAGAVARMTKSPLPFEKSAEGSSLLEWLEKKGGVRAVNSLLRTITENKGFAKAAFTFYPSVESLFVTKFAAELAPVKQAAKVTVTTQVTDFTDGEEKKKLVRDGFVIQDSREPSEKSELYEVDYVKRFTAPDKPGLYNVLMRNGGTAKAWVFNAVNARNKATNLVVDTDAQNYFLAESGAVFVRDSDIVDGDNAYEKAKDVSDISIGGKYVLINEHGDATMPFEVKAVVAEDGKRTKIKVYWKSYPVYDRPTYGHDFATLRTNSMDYACPVADRDYIQFADYKGRRLAHAGKDSIIVPSNWKALELNDVAKPEHYEARNVLEDYFQPGTLNDVAEALSKNAFHKMDVCSDDGLEYYVRMDGFMDGKPMNYKTAMIRLVGKYALDVKDAESLLKEAQVSHKCRRTVKLAQSPLVGAYMPPEAPLTMGMDEFTGVTTLPAQTQNISGYTVGQVPPQNTMRPGFNLGGESAMDLQASGLAEQAAQAGQKQIFDHSSIGGLAKIYDTAAIVDSYVPELMKSLDRLGRVLFLFYWKNEDFAERYGSEDLAEMEDTIRGVFKSYGDLVLQLRQKTIGAEETESNVI